MAHNGPDIFGIVNITDDSFSDGGAYLDRAHALSHARQLIQDGADVLDIGPASSHPDAGVVTPEDEVKRLSGVWSELQTLGVALSVDSFQPETQRWAIRHNADWINDINGFRDESLYDELADASCRLVMMHAIQSKGIATRAPAPQGDIWQHILRFFETRLTALDKAGIDRQRVVLDPGMGFFVGNDPQTSLDVLAGLHRLKTAFDQPVMICASRKSFLRALIDCTIEEAGPISLAAELWAAGQGVDYIRTHDAKQLSDALALSQALKAPSSPPKSNILK